MLAGVSEILWCGQMCSAAKTGQKSPGLTLNPATTAWVSGWVHCGDARTKAHFAERNFSLLSELTGSTKRLTAWCLRTMWRQAGRWKCSRSCLNKTLKPRYQSLLYDTSETSESSLTVCCWNRSLFGLDKVAMNHSQHHLWAWYLHGCASDEWRLFSAILQ